MAAINILCWLYNGKYTTSQGTLVPSASSSPIRVLLADDHPTLMMGFATLLTQAGMVVVAQIKTAEEAIEQCFRLKPDVIVLDVRFGPGMTGLDAARAILARSAKAKIIIYSQFDQPAMAMQAYKIGVAAYITKGSETEVLIEAIKQVHSGEKYMLPAMTDKFARMQLGEGELPPQSILDARELTVFKLMAEGYTNIEIARQLNLSEKTISNTTHSVKEKLKASRPAELTRIAIRNGLFFE